MGADCYETHRGPCRCGEGEFVVEECEPDHMYATASQRWWRSRIECSKCNSEYGLHDDGTHFVVVRKVDVADRQAKEQKYSEKSEEFMKSEPARAIVDEFSTRLSAFGVKAQAYRFLAQAGFHVHSQSSFTRSWTTAAAWVRSNIILPSHVRLAMKVLGKNDPEVMAALHELGVLRERAHEPLPVVGEPVASSK